MPFTTKSEKSKENNLVQIISIFSLLQDSNNLNFDQIWTNHCCESYNLTLEALMLHCQNLSTLIPCGRSLVFLCHVRNSNNQKDTYLSLFSQILVTAPIRLCSTAAREEQFNKFINLLNQINVDKSLTSLREKARPEQNCGTRRTTETELNWALLNSTELRCGASNHSSIYTPLKTTHHELDSSCSSSSGHSLSCLSGQSEQSFSRYGLITSDLRRRPKQGSIVYISQHCFTT